MPFRWSGSEYRGLQFFAGWALEAVDWIPIRLTGISAASTNMSATVGHRQKGENICLSFFRLTSAVTPAPILQWCGEQPRRPWRLFAAEFLEVSDCDWRRALRLPDSLGCSEVTPIGHRSRSFGDSGGSLSRDGTLCRSFVLVSV